MGTTPVVLAVKMVRASPRRVRASAGVREANGIQEGATENRTVMPSTG
jgi:hypothetical protein